MRRPYTRGKATLTGGVLGAKAVSLQDVDNFLDWLVDEGDGDSAKDLYSAVAWVFWCVNRRANAVAGMPYYVFPMELDENEEDQEKATEFGIDLRTTLWQVEAWIALKGAAYVLKHWESKRGRRRDLGNGYAEVEGSSVLEDLQVLNAYTMSVKTWDDRGKPLTFEQKVGNQRRIFSADEIVYFRTFDPSDDVREGVAAADVGKTPSKLVKSANAWATAFFENGAIPAVLLTTDSAVPPAEKERIEGVWNKMLAGAQRAWKTLVLERGLTPTVIQPPIGDLAMPDLERTKRDQILASFLLPPGLAEAKTNRAERDALKAEAYEECYIGQCETWIEPALNEQLFNALGLRLSFQYGQIEVLQARELEKAEASAFTVSIMKAAYESNVVSVDEYRSWIDQIGQWSNMPPLDENFEPEERTPPQLAAFTGEGEEPPEQGDGGGDGGPGEPTPPDERIEQRMPKALLDDLSKWERKAISRIKEGYPLKALEFKSEAIPPAMHRMIVHSLEHAVTLGDVIEVFRAARGEGKQIPFIPEGHGDPLPPVPDAVEISEADIDRAIKDWDKHMPDFAGLLDADVIHRENYDAESVAMG